MRIRRRTLALAAALALAPLSPALAQPATAPATTLPAAEADLSATITGVEGMVQVRESEGKAWQIAKPGMILPAGAEFRTGPRSAVRFEIPPGQTVTLDRLGVVKLVDAIATATNIKTDLGMKYGRVRFDVEAAGVSHNATIHSPSSSLGVRGTKVSLYDQAPFKPQAVSLTGRAEFRNAKKQMIAFGGKNAGKVTVDAEQSSGAETALITAQIHDIELQRTEQQLRELRMLFSNQGESFGNVAASNVRVSDAQLPSLLGGNLDFVLRWSQPGGADLNLFVRTPAGDTFGNPPFIFSLFPDNPAINKALADSLPPTSPTGGSVGLNHIGPEGIEIATFAKNFLSGIYVFGAYNFIPSDPAIPTKGLPKTPYTIEVFQGGKRLLLLLNPLEAAAGKEKPRFGYVFKDAITIADQGAGAVAVVKRNGKVVLPGKTKDGRPRVINVKDIKSVTVRKPTKK